MSTTFHAKAEQKHPVEDQIHHLKRQLAEAQIENERNKQRLEKLSLIVLEREKKICELQQYQSNGRKINEQRQTLSLSLESGKEHLQELQNDKERLCKELEESQQHAVQLERVIRFLHERQEESQLEINNLHDEFHKTQALTTELNEKIQAASHIQQQLEELIAQERLGKEEALEEVKSLHSQFESLKKMLSESKQKAETIQAERYEAEAALEKLKQEEINKAFASQTETEAHLKIAQQHLAKKVKETSDLHDKVHSQDLLIQELQNQLGEAQRQLLELQHSYEAQIQQEKRLQEQLCDSVKTAESIANKWEQKYFNIFEKWQENEMHLKEMKKIEAKHAQLQVLLANIGGFFETPMGYSTPKSEERSSKQQEILEPLITTPQSEMCEIEADLDLIENKTQIIETSNMKKPYQNLFDMPVQNKRLKHNLFE